MISGLSIPFAIETQRQNTVRIPPRNLVMATGDDVTLNVQCYDPDGTPTDISGGAITLTIIAAPQDPGGLIYGRYGYGGMGWDGWDYGMGWFTYRDRIIYQTAGDLTDPCCGQATITIPHETSTCWRGRYRFVVSLGSEYGGSVQTLGVLDVRPGALVARLGTAGYVRISDAVVGPAPFTGIGLLDGIGIVDGTTLAIVAGRIGTLAAPPFTGVGLLDGISLVDGTSLAFKAGRIGIIGAGPAGGAQGGPEIATFTVTLDAPAQQTVIVPWNTVDDTAMAPKDYTASEGTLTFVPGVVVQTIVVPVRAYDNSVQATQFSVHLHCGAGAVIVQADGVAVIPGWVGILDDVFVVDGTTAAFVPGLVGVHY